MTIYEQLADYCDCLTTMVDGEAVPVFEERHVNELINLISNYTCWAQHPCETFLQSERKEVKELPDCACDCDVYEFDPFFAPFDPESFTFTLVEQNGITETYTEVTSYIYSEADEKFRLELPLPDCRCRKPKCGCESKYKLMVTYVAGYEELPECLLPIFCEALQWVYDRSKCDCEECQDCDGVYKEEKQIDYTTLSGRLQEHFLNILSVQYFRQLSLISLCTRRNHLWGVVV